MGILLNMNSPFSFAITPVLISVIKTDAPGKGSLETASVIVPEKETLSNLEFEFLISSMQRVLLDSDEKVCKIAIARRNLFMIIFETLLQI